MPIPLKVPSLGESVTQATIGTWIKKEGDPVQADEPLVEVESEKATVALPAPAAGVLRRVLRQTGDSVTIGEVVGELEEGAAAQAQAASPAGSGPVPGGVVPAAKGNGATAAPVAPASTPAAEKPSTSTSTTTSTSTSRATRAPPSARRLMAERGVAAGAVQGSGPGGQVRKEDVLRALQQPQSAPAEV